MELVEPPSRAGMEQDFAPTQTQTQDPNLATGIKKKGRRPIPAVNKISPSFSANASGSKTYMLRSCLDPLIIEHAAQTHAQVLEEEGGDQALFFPFTLDDDEEDDRDEDAERPPKFYGSLISWSRGDQLGCIGILYVILALVLTNGRVMSDGKLFSFSCHATVQNLIQVTSAAISRRFVSRATQVSSLSDTTRPRRFDLPPRTLIFLVFSNRATSTVSRSEILHERARKEVQGQSDYEHKQKI
jgi:hypothetical protein